MAILFIGIIAASARARRGNRNDGAEGGNRNATPLRDRNSDGGSSDSGGNGGGGN